MKEISLKAWDLLRVRPLLWVPVLLADLAGQLVWQVEVLIHDAIVHAVAGHSVLGGAAEPIQFGSPEMMRAAMFAIPVTVFVAWWRSDSGRRG